MKALLVAALVLWPIQGMANELGEGLSERSLRELRETPERFLSDVASLILGYGTTQGIGRDGIALYVAVTRSKARAREMHRLLTADLDGDGIVTRKEVSQTIAAEAARSKARLVLGHRAADTNDDKRVTLEEMRVHAAQAGIKALSDAEAARLGTLLHLDADGDGFLSLDEAMAAVKRLIERGA